MRMHARCVCAIRLIIEDLQEHDMFSAIFNSLSDVTLLPAVAEVVTKALTNLRSKARPHHTRVVM